MRVPALVEPKREPFGGEQRPKLPTGVALLQLLANGQPHWYVGQEALPTGERKTMLFIPVSRATKACSPELLCMCTGFRKMGLELSPAAVVRAPPLLFALGWEDRFGREGREGTLQPAVLGWLGKNKGSGHRLFRHRTGVCDTWPLLPIVTSAEL